MSIAEGKKQRNLCLKAPILKIETNGSHVVICDTRGSLVVYEDTIVVFEGTVDEEVFGVVAQVMCDKTMAVVLTELGWLLVFDLKVK